MDVRTALPEGYELTLAGRSYRIAECEGRGASALVYRALYEDTAQPGLLRRVLLKELFPWHPDGAVFRDESGTVRCRREGEALLATHRQSFLRASRIHVQLQSARADKTPVSLDTCEALGTLFSIMGDSGCETLDRVMARGGVPLAVMAAWLRNLLYTLRAFHEQGLLHLDVSPDNILLASLDQGKPEKYRELFLIDYNSAWSGVELAQRQELLLSLKEPWSAPELRLGDVASVGPASDVYSVCMIFLQYLLGYPPVRHTPLRGLPPIAGAPALAGCSAVVFHQVASILRRGLKASPGQRFQTAQEAIDAFSELLERLEHGGVTHGALWEASAARLRAERERMPSAAEWEELSESRASLLDSLEAAGSCQITGGSGAGKTTLLAGLWLRGLRTYSPARPVPVYLPLCAWDGTADFVERAVLSMLSPGEGKTFEEARHGLARLLDEPGGGALLLLDGLEEAQGDADLLRAELRVLAALRGVTLIVSTRRAVRELGLKEVPVPPLTETEVAAYLARRSVEPPEGEKLRALLCTPVFLSVYARTEKRSRGEAGEDEALLDDYLDSLVSAAGEALGEEGALRARLAVGMVLPLFAWKMGERPSLAAESACRAAETCFALLPRRRFRRAFPQYMGRTRALLGGARDADDWFGLVVRDLLERRMALVWQDGQGAYHLFHQYFQPILARRWLSCRARLRRGTLRTLLPAGAALAVGIAAAAALGLLAERGPSAVQRQQDAELAATQTVYACGLLDLQLQSQDRLLTAAEDLPPGDEAAWEAWTDLLARETALLEAQDSGGEEAEALAERLSASGLSRETMEELFTLPDKNRGEWAAQQAALLRCLTPDAPYPEADRRSALAACRGLWEVRVREGFLLLSQAAAELPGDSGEPLLALLSDGVSWRAYAYQTNLDAEGYARGLAACRQEQGALWSELAGLGLLEQEELP